jgi:cell division septum initiation protein DivIVA
MPAESERRVAGLQSFTVALRGYRTTEVDRALTELRDQVDGLVADRDRLTEEKNQLATRLLSAIRRSNELDARVNGLSASAESAEGLSERIRTILELASAEASAITTQARELLDQARVSQTEVDRRRSELAAEEQQILAAARAEAEALQEQAREAASARRAEAQTEAKRILDEATTSAKAVVDQARRAAAADVDRLREHLLAELPRRLNAVLDDAAGYLPGRAEVTTGDGLAEPVVLPRQRQL